MDATRQLIERAFQQEAGQVLACLISTVGDFDLAEDALQDAIVAALETWSATGIPLRPGAWLLTTARRKAIDRVRRITVLASKTEELGHLLAQDQASVPDPAAIEFPDERLKLLFTCCHPALALEARVALTLHTIGGLATAEIAHAFFVPVPTMAQRLVRAKQKIRAARIPYRVPPLDLWPDRLTGVLAVLYLIFNAGYATVAGEQLIRHDLCREAIRLTRVLTELLGREGRADPEALGLLALMLLQDSRRAARVSPQGDLILLEDQDRSQWDHAAIAEGEQIVESALRMRHAGPYQVQAAIAAVHAQAHRAADTDWAHIAALYGVLVTLTPSPVIELNRAVAIALADGPLVGLRLLDHPHLASALASYHLYHAARADLLRRLDRPFEAVRAYQDALLNCQNAVERAFIQRRLAELGFSEAN